MLGKPYTHADAVWFIEMLSFGAFDNPSHKPKAWSGAGQKAIPEGGHQKRLVAVLRQKKELSDAIKRSFDEHKRAGGTMDALFELGRYVAFTSGTIFVPGPLKTMSRLMGKLMDFSGEMKDGKHERGYEGDYSRVKDEVRLTLVGIDSTKYMIACDVMKSIVSNPAYGMSFIKNVTKDPALDDCGYSDTNMVIKLPNGEPGEVQVNSKAVLFGKMSKREFCQQIGVSGGDYWILGKKYGVEGGLGHPLYEIFRENQTERGRLAASLSKRYYNVLRAFPHGDAEDRKKLVGELAAFRKAKENARYFAH